MEASMENTKIRKEYTEDQLVYKIYEHNSIVGTIHTGLTYEDLPLEVRSFFSFDTLYYKQIRCFSKYARMINEDNFNKLKELVNKLYIHLPEEYTTETLLKKIENSNNKFKDAKDIRNFITLLCITSSTKLEFLKYYDSLYRAVSETQ